METRYQRRSPKPTSDPTHAPERPGLSTARENPFRVQPFRDSTNAQPFGSQLADPLHTAILSNTTAEGLSALATPCCRPLPLPCSTQFRHQAGSVVLGYSTKHLTDQNSARVALIGEIGS
jgi:hypothetical protein